MRNSSQTRAVIDCRTMCLMRLKGTVGERTASYFTKCVHTTDGRAARNQLHSQVRAVRCAKRDTMLFDSFESTIHDDFGWSHHTGWNSLYNYQGIAAMDVVGRTEWAKGVSIF